MTVRLRPGLRVLRRTSTEVQVGTDPRWAVLLGDLHPAEVDALTDTDALTDLRTLTRRRGISPERMQTLVTALHDAGLTTETDQERTLPGPAAVEAAGASLARGTVDAGTLLRAREQCTVGVVGLGPTGLGLAVTLAASGVGTLVIDDDRLVRSADVGPAGYRWSDAGSVRATAAARILRDVSPGIQLGATSSPDVLVVVEHGAAAPERAQVLLLSGVPHLSVVVREADVMVGPFVQPEADAPGACLRCLDLHRVDLDPAWPVVAAQLAGPGRGAAARSGAAQLGEPTVVSSMAAAVAAADVLAVLDGCTPRTRSATIEIAVPDALPRTRSWAVHPTCGCTALPGTDLPRADLLGGERPGPAGHAASDASLRGRPRPRLVATTAPATKT
ncbi:ThiF family adenylyltransferase [Cellulomonas soli]|uniref:ThiF family adenylyltransferase n=1 Tax=Cellulomonas soli TaxID=931535 RepID=UPI003F873A63